MKALITRKNSGSQGGRAYEDQCEAIALKPSAARTGRAKDCWSWAPAQDATPRATSDFEQIVLVDYSTTQLKQAVQKLGFRGTIPLCGSRYLSPAVCPSQFRCRHDDPHPASHGGCTPGAASRWHGCLCGQAVFILEYANKHNLKAMLRYLLGKQKWSPFTPEAVEFVKLNFDFHPKTVRKWLEDTWHFHIESQRTVSHFRLGMLKKVLPLKLLVGLDSDSYSQRVHCSNSRPAFSCEHARTHRQKSCRKN